MRNKAASCMLLLGIAATLNRHSRPTALALPGYRYHFRATISTIPISRPSGGITPATCKAADGHRFGFELTFFRRASAAIRASTAPGTCATSISRTSLSAISMAASFYIPSAPIAPGRALPASTNQSAASGTATGRSSGSGDDQELTAIACNAFELHLTLHSEKPPVIHGENGVSQKAKGRPRLALHFAHAPGDVRRH